MSLFDTLQNTSAASRLNTVEAAYAGQAGAEANFKGEWNGYDEDGYGTVKINGNTYNAKDLNLVSATPNQDVIMRVGKDIKVINY